MKTLTAIKELSEILATFKTGTIGKAVFDDRALTDGTIGTIGTIGIIAGIIVIFEEIFKTEEIGEKMIILIIEEEAKETTMGSERIKTSEIVEDQDHYRYQNQFHDQGRSKE